MVRLLLLLFLAALVPQPSVAEPCTLKNNFCVPFVACTMDGNEFFFGRSYGRRSGPVVAQSRQGTQCEGSWKRTAIGAGRTEFACSDGRTGRGTFTYFEPTTGTATGRGRTSERERLRFWAGANILEFVLNGSEEDLELLDCVRKALDNGS